MKIKMRVHFAGPSFSASPGDEIERPDDEAMRLVQKGYAVALTAMPEVETAVPKPVVETRVAEPFAGKGDHDGNGKAGGAKKPASKARARR
jgi:hypothetical protein